MAAYDTQNCQRAVSSFRFLVSQAVFQTLVRCTLVSMSNPWLLGRRSIMKYNYDARPHCLSARCNGGFLRTGAFLLPGNGRTLFGGSRPCNRTVVDPGGFAVADPDG